RDWRSCVSFFFFSSRRRHTRSYGDWSSDVCSSDLEGFSRVDHQCRRRRRVSDFIAHLDSSLSKSGGQEARRGHGRFHEVGACRRSEERRVGKECRSRVWPEWWKKEYVVCRLAKSRA